MKMSLRSMISNALVAGILLTAMPMTAMQQQQSQQGQQQQAPQKESSWFGDKFRQAGQKIKDWHKEYVPNVADGVDAMAKKGDSALRDFATSSVGQVGLALLGAFCGLAICHYLTKDKSGVNILDQMLGFFKGIFGEDRYNQMSDRGLDAVEQNDAFTGVMKGMKTAHSVNKAANETTNRFNEAGKLADDVANVGNPIRDAWNNVTTFVGNAWNGIFGSPDNKENKPAAQQPAQSQANQQQQQAPEPNAIPRTNNGNGVPPQNNNNNNNNNNAPQSTGQSSESSEVPRKLDRQKGALNMFVEQIQPQSIPQQTAAR